MNIVITTETYLPFIAGVSTSTDNIARFMAHKGHQVTIVAPKPEEKDEIEMPKNCRLVRTISFPDFFFHGKTFSPIPFPIPALLHILQKDQVDLVHIQEPGAIGWCALAIAKLRGIPVFAALHTTPDQVIRIMGAHHFRRIITGFLQAYMRFFYNFVSMIMVPTNTFKTYVEAIGIDRPIVPVSNGVDINVYSPRLSQQNNTKLHRNLQEVYFLYLGRVDQDKEIDVIVRALEKTNSHIRLVIAGKGNAEQSLRQLAQEKGVADRITWPGMLRGSSIVHAYQTSDCFVIMSPYETQSIVALEAIACGLPILACKEGALPELCHNRVNGYTLAAGDYLTLAEKMNELASDPQLRKRMGKESRRISLPHDRTVVLTSLEKLYEKVAASKR